MVSRWRGNAFFSAGLPLMAFIVGGSYVLSQVCCCYRSAGEISTVWNDATFGGFIHHTPSVRDFAFSLVVCIPAEVCYLTNPRFLLYFVIIIDDQGRGIIGLFVSCRTQNVRRLFGLFRGVG